MLSNLHSARLYVLVFFIRVQKAFILFHSLSLHVSPVHISVSLSFCSYKVQMCCGSEKFKFNKSYGFVVSSLPLGMTNLLAD